MTNDELRKLAEAALKNPFGFTRYNWDAAITPERVIALLDEVRDLRLTDSQKKNALENIYAKCHPAEDSVPGTHDELCNRTLLGVKALEQQNAALRAALTEIKYGDHLSDHCRAVAVAALASVNGGES